MLLLFLFCGILTTFLLAIFLTHFVAFERQEESTEGARTRRSANLGQEESGWNPFISTPVRLGGFHHRLLTTRRLPLSLPSLSKPSLYSSRLCPCFSPQISILILLFHNFPAHIPSLLPSQASSNYPLSSFLRQTYILVLLFSTKLN